MNILQKANQKIEKKVKLRWKDPFRKISIPSSLDDENQSAYYYAPDNSQKRPLIVSLHTWAGTYKQPDPVISKECVNNDWYYIHPDFRGVNNTPQAVGSDLSMTDLNDAIQYVIDNGNVDLDNIFIVGGSGGAYTALCFYTASNYPINTLITWSPITDLIAWHDQSMIRKSRYAQDILNATQSTSKLKVEEAKKRSPLYRDIPENNSNVYIFTGYHDGYGDLPVPVTHSIDFYNKYANHHGAEPSDLVPDAVATKLTAREILPTNELIEGKNIIYTKQFKNAYLAIFDGGHDHLANHSVRLIKENIKSIVSV